MKICFICKKKIGEKDHHYKFIEFKKEKEIKKGYAHKKCYDDFLNQRKNMEEAMGMMRGFKGKLKEFGILPEKEVIIT